MALGKQKWTELEINEEEAKIVRQIFKKYLKYSSIRMVSNWLNENNIPTRSGTKWWDSMVAKLLSRKTYIGVVQMNGGYYKDENLRIIDNDLFIKAQELREERRRYSPRIINR